MSRIDASIESDKSKNRLVVIASVVLLTVLLVSYLAWLFVIQGFTFTVNPSQAAASARFSVQSGSGLFIDNKLYVLGLPVDVQVGADKYQPANVTLDTSSASTQTITLQPLPAQVTVTPEPQIADVQWSVNGAPHSTGDSVSLALPAGQHTISAQHPAYEPAQLTLQTEIAETISRSLPMTPVQGSLQIASTPAGATVHINGQQAGTTPLTVARPGGTYNIEIQHAGFAQLRDTIEITASNKTPQRNYQLAPEQAALTVSVQPVGGILTLNSKPVQAGTLSVEANRRHTLTYQAPGYATATQTVTLAPGGQDSLEFALSPVTGQVTVTANLPATVLIDGKPAGSTPLTTQLQALPHVIEVQKEGYRTVSRKVTPSPDQTRSVNATLLTEFDARRAEGKPLFAETLGIQLIRLKPEAFTMGSPPNEAGRQRNEHQIKVEFTRAVWVSRHEITEAQFARFQGKQGGTKQPVTGISWLQAAEFTNWLSVQEGLAPFYIIQHGRLRGFNPASRGYRLPTEAEWEYVARQYRRAQTTTYVWGSQDRLQPKQGNFADSARKGQQTFVLDKYEDGFADKAPVGSFKADRGGFYDLDGNVREWVHDFYTVVPPDLSQTHTDYTGSAPSASHVVKGASFKTGRLKRIRAGMRTGEAEPQDDIGFRIARYDQ